MSIAGNVRTVNSYDIHRNSGLDLRALLADALSEARTIRMTVRNEKTCEISSRVGTPIHLTGERAEREYVKVKTVEGTVARVALHEIDRAAVLGDYWEAA